MLSNSEIGLVLFISDVGNYSGSKDKVYLLLKSLLAKVGAS